MAEHLSIFMENKPGALEKITKVLAENKISIRAQAIASSGEFGIIKLLVNDPDKAHKLLKENGVAVSKRKITITLLDDKAGSFHELLLLLSGKNINIEDCYGFLLEKQNKAAIIFEIEKHPEAESVLKKNGYKIMTQEQIYKL